MLPIFVVVRSLEWQLSRLASHSYIHANQSTRRSIRVCIGERVPTLRLCVRHTNTHTQSHWPVGHTSLHSTWPTCARTFVANLSLSLSVFILSVSALCSRSDGRHSERLFCEWLCQAFCCNYSKYINGEYELFDYTQL